MDAYRAKLEMLDVGPSHRTDYLVINRDRTVEVHASTLEAAEAYLQQRSVQGLGYSIIKMDFEAVSQVTSMKYHG
jgi:hypothetical protein